MTGQDGSYLAELLLAKEYEVHAIVRRSSSFSTGRIEQLYQDPHVSGALELDWREHVEVDSHYLRPAEGDSLLGDATKARNALGWEPKVSFNALVTRMAAYGLKMAEE